MEFRLNKVDLELRQKIKDTTSSGKVHRKDKIKINDHKENKSSKDRNFAYKLKKAQDDKDKIVVEAYKSDNLDVEAFREEAEYDGGNKGIFIDAKK